MDKVYDYETPLFDFKLVTTKSYNLTGWLYHISESKPSKSNDQPILINLCFVNENLETFIIERQLQPYFYIHIHNNMRLLVVEDLHRKYAGELISISESLKLDTSSANHINNTKKVYNKLVFKTKAGMVKVLSDLRKATFYKKSFNKHGELLSNVKEIKEYDLDSIIRYTIDKHIRVGHWYQIIRDHDVEGIELLNREDRPKLRTLSFDIECFKEPLLFPDSTKDEIFLISITDEIGKSILITNKKYVPKQIEDFTYKSPSNITTSETKVYNEPTEKRMIERFFRLVKAIKPHIFVTFNGDMFDLPYLKKRCEILFNRENLIHTSLGLEAIGTGNQFVGQFVAHADCYLWVKRDSYLPQGSQGLKSVTRIKLGYEPEEVDPEEMVYKAEHESQEMCEYSISDSVATNLLYKKLVHSFIFSIASVVPCSVDLVMRKGTGYLCEALLMANAYTEDIIFPNKTSANHIGFYKGHLLESETYVGGYVEANESGMFRHDINYEFNINKRYLKENIIDKLDEFVEFLVTKENKGIIDHISKESIKNAIETKLNSFMTTNKENTCENKEIEYKNESIKCKPAIFHFDVGAMYPNIIITNRLQPTSIINESQSNICTNHGEFNCRRELNWEWKGKYYPATKAEIESIAEGIDKTAPLHTLLRDRENSLLIQRIKKHSMQLYRKNTESIVEKKTSFVCQRANPFYVDTVLQFRDKRYVFKSKVKEAHAKMQSSVSSKDKEYYKELMAVYDSLQLAHKCILNSFYGYVMRKGSRWYSMAMAAITTHIGGNIIKLAKKFIDKIGRPLELDTDGVWCMVPTLFPIELDLSNYSYSNKPIKFNFLCSYLNYIVNKEFTNKQIQLFNSTANTWEQSSRCDIYFEADGPYAGMFLPASHIEGKELKKRYVVFNFDGSQAELKGFEIKRRGELELMKLLQKSIFDNLLEGTTLRQLYKSIAENCRKRLDVVTNKGQGYDESYIISLITETKHMSNELSKYGSQRSTAITTAKRLIDLFGEVYRNVKGLAVKFFVINEPYSDPVSERAVPVQILQYPEEVREEKLMKWAKLVPTKKGKVEDIRRLIDWEYYKIRLHKNILKLVCIPAIYQGIENPISEISIPDWVYKKSKYASGWNSRQQSLSQFIIEKPKCIINDKQDAKDKIKPIKDININEINNMKLKELNEKLKSKLKESQKEYNDYTTKENNETKDFKLFLKKTFSYWGLIRDKNILQKRMALSSSFSSSSSQLLNNNYNINVSKEISSGKPFEILQISSINEANFKTQTSVLLSNQTSIQKYIFLFKYSFYIFTNYKLKQDPLMFKFNEIDKVIELKNKNDSNEYKFVYQIDTNNQLFNYENTLAEFKKYLTSIEVYSADVITPTLTSSFLLKHFSTLKQTRNKFENIKITNSLNTNDIKNVFLYHYKTHSLELYCFNYINEYCNDIKTVSYFMDKVTKREFTPNFAGNMKKEFPGFIPADKYSIEDAHSYTNKMYGLFLKTIKKEISTICPKRLLIIQSNSPAELNDELKELSLCYSYFFMKPNLEQVKLSAVGWQNQLSNFIIYSYILTVKLQLFTVLKDLSKYAMIPINTLSHTFVQMSLDILFLRYQIKHNYVNYGDFRVLSSLTNTGNNNNSNIKENSKVDVDECFSNNIEVTKKGYYRSICLDIKLENFELSALLSKKTLRSINKEKIKDLLLLVSFALELNKSLLKSEAGVKYLFPTYIKWVKSRSKEVSKYLRATNKRIFDSLITILNENNIKVVYASFTRLIVCTGMYKIEDALNYYTYVANVIKADEDLSYIKAQLSKTYSSFLFLNAMNYSGLLYNKETEKYNCSFNWEIEHLFPKLLSNYFRVFINYFLKAPFIKYQSEEELKMFCENGETSKHYLKDLIKNEITNKLLKVIISLKNADSTEKYKCTPIDFSVDISQYYSQNSQTLTNSNKSESNRDKIENSTPENGLNLTEGLEVLTKCLTTILLLEKSISKEVYMLKRVATRALKPKDGFNKTLERSHYFRKFDDSQKKVHIKLPNIICEYCSEYFEYDVYNNLENIKNNQSGKCTVCSSSFALQEIEMKLVEVTKELHKKYINQELRCKDCKRIKTNFLMEYCVCSADKFENAYLKMDKLNYYIGLLDYISKELNFETLQKEILQVAASFERI